MAKSHRYPATPESQALQDGLKRKYQQYHEKDKDRFRDIIFTSHRPNYQPMKDSFEEEFYVKRGIDKFKTKINIPSTSLLAKIFHDNYIPDQNYLTDCWSYIGDMAAGSNNEIIIADNKRSVSATVENEMFIDRPRPEESVERLVMAEGKVKDPIADLWLVVRPSGSYRYFVQPKLKVSADGSWKRQIYIGSLDEGNIGHRFDICGFVNPKLELTEGDELDAWPEADYCTDVRTVIRAF